MPAMDPAVVRAIARWPQVPNCSGWLALDDRGRWWLRDHAGPVPWPRDGQGRLDKSAAGPVLHAGLAAFIGRNYGRDADGAWFFQNGPQRVDVSLEAAPWIVRIDVAPSSRWAWHTHTGMACEVDAGWTDSIGRIWVRTNVGAALLHSSDVPAFAARLDAADRPPAASGLPPAPLPELPAAPDRFFGFRLDPPG